MSESSQFEGYFKKNALFKGRLINKLGEFFEGEFKDDKPWSGFSFNQHGKTEELREGKKIN